ncbi:phosphoribosyltransferase [Cohnella thailandensis]|uniref:Phosphoribosyltransferase n=1 Tax=Cohnella thailandensis TaxID=557557 RepID=A0A841SUJ8_9BACL|nr:phosphoribosyltransferase [Cohnella thailandensis]MBB6635993.1 phosphoribosyltransferase [Cohnella thailandensis]MBP1976371.1 adenine phosphoribosyltransferase [Cohnella thailandensis]
MTKVYAQLDRSIRDARSVRIMKTPTTAYDFKLYPFGERGTYIAPELMAEIADSLAESARQHFGEYDYIVSPEPGGHTWGILAAYKLGKPMNILRLSTELYEEYEVRIKRETAYNENYLYFDGFKKGDRILLVDDVISSGATIRCIAAQFLEMGVEMAGIQAIIAKGEHYRKLETDLGVPVRCLTYV